ncbi:MAG TPA: group 1 truncated hemoglobin [Polyangiaceae bacterium]
MTAFDDIGGEGPVRAVLQELYDRLFEDPIVGFLFEGKDKARIVEQQVAFTSAFLGGPNRYTGKAMPEVHAQLPLLPGHFDRRHHVLKQVLEAHGVPEAVRATWLRIDAGLRSSVLATGEEAREMTRKAP